MDRFATRIFCSDLLVGLFLKTVQKMLVVQNDTTCVLANGSKYNNMYTSPSLNSSGCSLKPLFYIGFQMSLRTTIICSTLAAL